MIRPHYWVHRGCPEVSAFFFDARLMPLEEARGRILRGWEPGSEVYRVEGGLVWRLPRPRRVEVSACPGAPLVAQGRWLSSAPLVPLELEALEGAEGAVVLVRGGCAAVVLLEEREREDPSRWLDVGSLEPVRVEGLGAPPRPAELAPQPEKEVRALLGVRAPVDARAEAAAAALREKLSGDQGALAHRKGGGVLAAGLRGIGVGASVGVQLLVWLSRWLPRSQAAPTRAPSHATGPARPAWIERLRAWAARMLVRGSLATLIGRRHAQYLARLMDQFRGGDLFEALRHAIPLRSLGEPNRVALGPPSPRTDLRLSMERSSGGAAIGLGDELFEMLRTMYRQAFERLVQQGKIDEAAFVLAELLDESERAVDFLVQHGKARVAAELAEARKLAPALVVRQWMIAGDLERAVRVARTTGAFGAAVLLMERRHDASAQVLRLAWAEVLASAGDYAGAVLACWPVERARRLAERWIDLAIARGGPGAAVMLVRLLELRPDRFDEVAARVRALLEDDGPEHVSARAELASALERVAGSLEVAALARPVVRAVVRDAFKHGLRISPDQLRRLAQLGRDGALRVDLPRSFTPPEKLIQRASPLVVSIESSRGSAPIRDIARLPSGDLLLALGDAGVRHLRADGRMVAHYAEPATQLVLSDHGDRVIAVARRDGSSRLSRIDLSARRATVWHHAELGSVAASFDGSLWFVAEGQAVSAIDALAQGWKALWRIPELGGFVSPLVRFSNACRFIVHRGGTLRAPVEAELWSLELPSLTLRGRTQLQTTLGGVFSHDLLVAQTVVGLGIQSVAQLSTLTAGDGQLHLGLVVRADGGQVLSSDVLALNPDACVAGPPAVSPPWVALSVEASSHRNPEHERSKEESLELIRSCVPEVLLCSAQDARPRCRILFEGADSVVFRLQNDALVAADDLGRAVVVDLELGTVLRELRV